MTIQHVVFLRFPFDPDEAFDAEIRARVRAFPEHIPGALAMRFGSDTTGAPTLGFQYCLVSEYADAETLDGYENHPHHQQFAGWAIDKGVEFAVINYELDADTVIV